MDLYFQMFKKEESSKDSESKKKEESRPRQQVSEETLNEIWQILQDFVNTQPALDGSKKKPPISKRVLSTLEVHFVTKSDVGEQELCTICLEKFKEDEQTFILPKCKHQYHKKCLTTWFMKNNSCPICRYEFPTDDSDYEWKKLDAEAKKQRKKDAINSMYM